MELDNLGEKCKLVSDCVDAVRKQIDLSFLSWCIDGWVDSVFNLFVGLLEQDFGWLRPVPLF